MNIVNPELIRFRARFFDAVYERQLRLCTSERQSFYAVYQKYTNLSIHTGFYGTTEQAYSQYRKFKREVIKILANFGLNFKYIPIKNIKYQ